MEYFDAVELDPVTKRPRLEPEEVEMVIQTDVAVLTEEKKTLLVAGVARLTSHRFYWLDAKSTCAYALAHSKLERVEEHQSGIIHRRQQIRLYLTGMRQIRVDFDDGGRDKFLQLWEDALQRRLWEKKKAEKTAFTSSDAGIAGLMRKQQERQASDSASLSGAFTDLNALVASADDLVKLANRLRRARPSSAATSELDSVFAEIGIVAPITRASAGSLFHEELARQLCGWLLDGSARLLRSGMASLPDVYCAFNRARGTQLISPEDLYRAALLMADLQLPLRLHEFPSGVKVLRRVDQQSFTVQIAAMVEQRGHVAAFALAEALDVSMAIATEQLLAAEDEGMLCRDDTIQGLLFYENRWFKKVQSA